MDYGSKTAKEMSFNPCKPNHYPGANVRGSGHNYGDASDPRSDRVKKNRKGGYGGHSAKSKGRTRKPQY